jgi:transcription elongation factor Elf1
MAKTKEFKIENRRLLFKCPSCGARRTSIIPDIRRKSIRCHQCGELTKCLFNRRPEPREIYSGKLMLKMRDGRKVEVTLRDISSRGIGLELPSGKSLKMLSVGSEFTLTCSWNPKLVPDARYIVRNIHGLRIGAEKAKR